MEHYNAAFKTVLSDPDRFSMEITTEERANMDELPSDTTITAWEVDEKRRMDCLSDTCSDAARSWAYVAWL